MKATALYALVPRETVRGWSHGSGALKLFLLMLGLRARQNRAGGALAGLPVRAPPEGWPAALGAKPRAVRLWRRELVKAGLIVPLDGERPRWRIVNLPGEGRIFRVPLEAWPLPNMRPELAALYAVLCCYRNRRTRRADPSQAALAADLQITRETVSRRLRWLETPLRLAVIEGGRHGNTWAHNRYLMPWPGDADYPVDAPAPPLTLPLARVVADNGREAALAALEGRHETSHGGGMKRHTGAA